MEYLGHRSSRIRDSRRRGAGRPWAGANYPVACESAVGGSGHDRGKHPV